MNNTQRRAYEKRMKERMSLKEKIKAGGVFFTAKEIFSSPQVENYVANKVKYLCEDFYRPPLPVKVRHLEGVFNIVAYTDSIKAYINSAHPLFDGSHDIRLQKVCGAAAHEAAHYLFTNFNAMTCYFNSLRLGKLYPSFPIFSGGERESEYVLNENAEKLADFLEGKNGFVKSKAPDFTNRDWLIRIAKRMYNILEDGRIENIFSNLCYENKTLYYGLLEIIKAQRESCLDFDELLRRTGSKNDAEVIYPIEAVMMMMLHYIRFGEIKGFRYKDHKDAEIVKSFYKITPYLDEFLESMNAYECLTLLNKILITLWPEVYQLAELLNDEYDESQLSSGAASSAMDTRSAVFPGTTAECSEGNTGEGTDSKEFAKASPESKTSPTEKPEGDGEKRPSENKSSSGESSEVESGEKTEEKKEGFTIGEGKEGSDDSPTSGEKTAEEGCSFSGENGVGAGEGVQDEESSSMEASDFARQNSLSEKLENAATSETGKKESEGAKLSIKNFSSQMAKSRTKNTVDEVLAQNQILDASIGYGDIHKGVTSRIVRRNPSYSNISEYKANETEIKKLVKDMLRKSTFLKEEDDNLLVKNKYSGSRFNAGSTAKGDYKYFSKEMHLEPAYNLDVIILCDESGSMRGARIEAAKAAAICCYEYMLEASGQGHVAVYGHQTAGREVILNCYADFDSPDENDRYRIMQIDAGGSNRDGYALRYVKEKISLRDAERKLIITISDGQPAATDYYGMPAMHDIQSVLREAERENIMYIAAAIGADKEVIKKIYGEKHFLDLSDLQQLPTRLMGLIARLLK